MGSPVRRLSPLWSLARRLVALGAGVLLSSALALLAWSALPTLLGPFSSRLVTSGSMSPVIRQGDVVVTRPPSPGEQLAPPAVIAFRRGDRVITHRVVRSEPGGYVTRGDANDVEDSELVAPGDVLGVGSLVVPRAGALTLVAHRQPLLLVLGGGAVLVLGVAATGRLRPARGRHRRPRHRRRAAHRRRGRAGRWVARAALVGAIVAAAVVAAPTGAGLTSATANVPNQLAAAALSTPSGLSTTKESITLVCRITVSWAAAVAPANGFEYRFGYNAVPSGAWTATTGTSAVSMNIVGLGDTTINVEVRSRLTGTSWASSVATTSRHLTSLCVG